tara:strand:+ start:664 stop:858 length:195 start_codon:yes stop_codon:yes gene_type:complete
MAMMYPSNNAAYNRMTVLEDEIKILRSRIQPHDTGHLYTAISVLEDRVDELIKEYLGDINKNQV